MHPVLPSVHPHISLTDWRRVDPSGQTPIKSKGVDQRAIFMCSRPSYFSFIWGSHPICKNLATSRIDFAGTSKDKAILWRLSAAAAAAACVALGMARKDLPCRNGWLQKFYVHFYCIRRVFPLPFSYFWLNLRRIYYGCIRGKILYT